MRFPKSVLLIINHPREVQETVSIALVVEFVDLVALELQTPEPRVVEENRRNSGSH